jgi:hypothetical protein
MPKLRGGPAQAPSGRDVRGKEAWKRFSTELETLAPQGRTPGYAHRGNFPGQQTLATRRVIDGLLGPLAAVATSTLQSTTMATRT